MEFFLFLLYNQENSKGEEQYSCKERRNKYRREPFANTVQTIHMMKSADRYCDVNLDEDEYYRFVSSDYKECPYYRSGDEYKVVRHQM